MNLSEFRKSKYSKNPHFLLFGHPVEHSWSPLMHNTALQHWGMEGRYLAIDLQPNELNDLAAFMNNEQFRGANVTIPYKQQIASYMDDIDEVADAIGAVNTIVPDEFRLGGYNTDCDGFLAPLEEYDYLLEDGHAVVFGTGGASRAIVVALKRLGLQKICLVSRSPAHITSFIEFHEVQLISYDQWPTFAEEASLIVNATPLGMHPNTQKSPVRDSEIELLADRICYDIVYNPLKTTFLRQAEEAGATTIGGLEMLVQQGSRSFKLWTGSPFPLEKVMNTLYEKLGN